MSFNEPKPTLQVAIDKIIWNIHSTKQSSIGCSPISKHFNRSPNTFRKSLVSHAINLDKGKSIMSRDRAQDWETNDTIEDGYLDNAVADKRGYESDPTDKTDQDLQRAPLANPFSYFKPLGGKPLSDTTHTVTLDNGHVLRKLDLAFKKISNIGS